MPGLLKGTPPSALIPRALREATDRAAMLLRGAEAEADAILAEARREADDERERVRADAAAAGRREGLAQAAAALAAVAEARRRRLEGLEDELARTALDVARALVGELVAHDPAVVAPLARRALELARSRREVVLRICPADAPFVHSEARALSAMLERCPALGLREDPTLSPGDVIVETEAGRVDARVETRLAELARAVEEDESCGMG